MTHVEGYTATPAAIEDSADVKAEGVRQMSAIV